MTQEEGKSREREESEPWGFALCWFGSGAREDLQAASRPSRAACVLFVFLLPKNSSRFTIAQPIFM